MLSILMLHYGEQQVDLTRQCIDRLKACTKGEHEILLWINGEVSAAYNAPLFGHHDNVAGTDERLSLAAAYNRAVHHVRGDLFCIIHNDCFVEEGWNLPLEHEALKGNVAFPVVKGNEAITAARGVPPVPDWMPPSCCFVIGKDELETLAGWDERFEFCHFEDMDLFKRATDAGMKLVQCPANVFHLRGVTRADQVEKANKAFRTNELRYARKHGTRDGAKISYPFPVLERLEAKETPHVSIH